MSVPRTQSLTKAIALLRAMERFPRGVSTAELARVTDLPPATAGRLLATLAGRRLRRTRRRGLEHRARARAASRSAPSRSAPWPAAPSPCSPSSRPRGEGVGDARRPARARARVVVVAQADGPRLLGITNWVGRPIDDLHASAAGKLLLAELDDRGADRVDPTGAPRG